MGKIIGNIGVLDLTQATEESIQGIERIGNVGVIRFKAESAHLLTRLDIGNIGKSVEVPRGYRIFEGMLYLNADFLRQYGETGPQGEATAEAEYLFATGEVIIDPQLDEETFKAGMQRLHLKASGEVYAPAHLAGAVTAALVREEGNTEIHIFENEAPRFENGKLQLTNVYLESIALPLYLVVNGKVQFARDLDMELFKTKIDKICVNGKATLYEEQAAGLYGKLDSSSSPSVEIIPSGFEYLNKMLRLNSRSIRRYQGKKLYTRHPILIEADVSREAFAAAIAEIKSSSLVVCSETLEDLVWERSPGLDTEVLSFEQRFVWIEDEETWSNDQLLAFEQPVNLVVYGELTFEADVTEEAVREKIRSIDLFGEIHVMEKKVKAVLYPYLRTNQGSILEKGVKKEQEGLGNIGKLSL